MIYGYEDVWVDCKKGQMMLKEETVPDDAIAPEFISDSPEAVIRNLLELWIKQSGTGKHPGNILIVRWERTGSFNERGCEILTNPVIVARLPKGPYTNVGNALNSLIKIKEVGHGD